MLAGKGGYQQIRIPNHGIWDPPNGVYGVKPHVPIWMNISVQTVGVRITLAAH